MNKLIYLASPYTHHDHDSVNVLVRSSADKVMYRRFMEACQYAAAPMRIGVNVFCPVAHNHTILQFGLPHGWKFWRQYDEVMLDRCESMIVLMLDGWRESVGVSAEIEFMMGAGKHIEWHTPDGECMRAVN